jgi:CHAT domain-containing protein
LIVLPHGDLHGLPFAALRNRTTGRTLLEDFTVTYAASASVAAELRRGETPVEGRAFVLGAPVPEVVLSPLPGAAEEARRVAEGLGVTVHLGAEAQESLLSSREPIDVLHLAAHGSFVPEAPTTSHIALAPGGGHDGRPSV